MKNNINPTTQDLRRKLQIRRKITAVVKKITREKIFSMWKIITTTLLEIIFSHLILKYTPKKHSLNEEEKPRIGYKNQKWGASFIQPKLAIILIFSLFFSWLLQSRVPTFFFFHFGVPTIICQDQLLQHLLHSSLAVPSTFAASTLLDVASRSCSQKL